MRVDKMDENLPIAENPDATLTPRQRSILKIVVQEYISTAYPIGSSSIRQLGRLGVSSATIRNELSQLEEWGYLAQPHTSAGRVPTVRGYRYFVEQLMEAVDLSAPEQRMIRHQFHQLRMDLDQWMRLTAAVLAHTAQAAALVTPPRTARTQFKHLELISINDALCLLILVLQGGNIHQEMLITRTPISQEVLSQTSNKMNGLLNDLTLTEIKTNTQPELAELSTFEAEVLQRVVDLMQQVERPSTPEIYSDGLINVLRQPEFEDAAKFSQVLEVLEHHSLLESILRRSLDAGGIQIIIGGEGDYEDIDDVSLVLSRYGIEGRASGVLGVLGPTRMSYGRAISAVRYVARLMDSLIADVYGEPC